MSRPLRRRLLVLGRVLVSLLLVGYLLTRSDVARVAVLWYDIALRLIVLAVGLQLSGIFISSLKWWLLLRATGACLSYLWLVRLYFVGHFFSNFLPTMIGGDAVRAYQLSRRLRSPTVAISSVFVERLTGFLALAVIAWIAFVLTATTASVDAGVLWLAFWCIAAATAGLAVAFATPLAMRLLSWLKLPHLFGWRAALERIRQSLVVYRDAPRTLILVVGLSFAYQFSWIATNAATAWALDLHVPISLIALTVPLSDIVGLLPIFFNSLGAREGTFVLLLDQSGVVPEQALALSLLIYGVRLVVSLVGGVLHMAGGAWGSRDSSDMTQLASQDQDV